jgi:hypothetical protein
MYMVCALLDSPPIDWPSGEVEIIEGTTAAPRGWADSLRFRSGGFSIAPGIETAGAEDPFDDFEDDDFDDEFDDDFEEDWEDDLTEDEEFPDTFGGGESEDEDEEEESPFADDPDFDDD